MMWKTSRLIPRYNWDFSLSSLAYAVKGTLRSGHQETDAFEELFGLKPIYTSSGRTSLYLILKALELPRNARVGVPLFCCSVVFDAIVRSDLIPTFIDINAEDCNISVTDLLKKRDQLSAVIVVHMFGHPVDMDAILSACHTLPVIEDCAQSLFSMYKGRLTGILSTASFFSFRTGKYISAGEGGMVLCKDDALRNRIRALSTKLEPWSIAEELTYSFATFVKSVFYRRPLYGLIGYPIGRKLDRKLNLSAKSGFKHKGMARSHRAIVHSRMKDFRLHVQKQIDNALFMEKLIERECLVLPQPLKGNESNYYQFVIKADAESERNLLSSHLFQNNVDSAPYLDDIVTIASSVFGYTGGCPVAEGCSKTILVIPHYYTLAQSEVEQIATMVSQWKRRRNPPENRLVCQLQEIAHLGARLSVLNGIMQTRVKLLRRTKRELFHLRNLTRMGFNYLHLAGTAPPLRNPPLLPGETVKVRSRNEIVKTLDSWDRSNGCLFIDEMYDHCDSTYRVLKTVGYFYDEAEHRMCRARSAVILEGVVCSGRQRLYSVNCDRSCFFFWDEAWLERANNSIIP